MNKTIPVSALIERGNVSRYFLDIIRKGKDAGPILPLVYKRSPIYEVGNVTEISQHDLARLLVLGDLFDALKPSKKSMAELFERLDEPFKSLAARALDVAITKDLYYRIEVLRYIQRAREVLK